MATKSGQLMHLAPQRGTYKLGPEAYGPLLKKQFNTPEGPAGRLGSFSFHLNPLNRDGHVGALSRRMGLCAFIILFAEGLARDWQMYGPGAALEAINRAPKEALARGAKHLIVNYLVPHTRFAVAWAVTAAAAAATYVAITHLWPWLDTGHAKYTEAQDGLIKELGELEAYIRQFEQAHALRALSQVPRSDERAVALVDMHAEAPVQDEKGTSPLGHMLKKEPATWNDLCTALTAKGVEMVVIGVSQPSLIESEEDVGDSVEPSQQPGYMTTLNRNTYVNDRVANIFGHICDMYAAAKKKCPYKDLSAFRDSSAQEVITYLSSPLEKTEALKSE